MTKEEKRLKLKRLVELDLKLSGESGKMENCRTQQVKPRVLQMAEYADLCDELKMYNRYAHKPRKRASP